jgi:hypothetical protein
LQPSARNAAERLIGNVESTAELPRSLAKTLAMVTVPARMHAELLLVHVEKRVVPLNSKLARTTVSL